MQKEISKYGLTLLLMLIGLVLPAIIAVCHGYSNGGVLCANICYSLLLASIILLIPNRAGRWIGWNVLVFFSLLEIIHSVVYSGDLCSAGFIRSLFMTTPHESEGALSVIPRQHVIWIIFLVIYYICVSVLLVKGNWNNRIRFYGFYCLASLSFLVFVGEIVCSKNIDQIVRQVPFNSYMQSAEAIRQVAERNAQIKHRGDFSYDATRDSIPDAKELYVLVIDESLSYNHLSLGGYERTTTPHLETMPNLVSFSDYSAPAVFTMYAVPLLITPATPETFDSHYSMRGIQQAYKECGFATYWVTHDGQLVNDGVSGYIADGVDEIISVKNDADIPATIDSLASRNDKLFVIAHLWGSHQHYANATKTICCYSPNRLQSREVHGEELFVNSYDNTILYTDSILYALTAIMQEREGLSMWMFVSDHGEGPIGKYGGAHGYSTPKESEYHVPLIVWYNDKFAAIYPNKVKNALQQKHEPICGDYIFGSILDIAGVKIREDLQNEGMSIFGDTLLLHERKILLPDGKTITNLK